MNKLLTVLIPTFNNFKSFSKVVSSYSNDPRVVIIVSDDSNNLKEKKAIRELCHKYNIDYFLGPNSKPTENWNILLNKIKTPFFVLNHHDEYPNNLQFMDYLNQKNLAFIVLPCNSIQQDKGTHKIDSWQQKIISKICFTFPNASFNIFLAPTASLIINEKMRHILFDNNLSWFVDAEWYLRLYFESLKYNLEIKFFKFTRIISSQNENSITNSLKKDLKKQIEKEKIYLSKLGFLPNKFIRIFQLIIFYIILFNTKLRQYIR